MTISGSIDHYITSSMANEMFVNAYNFFNSAGASALGITRIAYNHGAGGSGMGFHDSGSPAGDNAWALFRFGNAQIPFYILVQYTQTATLGTSPGNPATNNLNSGRAYGYAYQIAQRIDGGSPWNGSTLNNGADTKGTPVWTAGGSTMAVYPIVNSKILGFQTASASTSIDYMRSFFNVTSSSCRLHLFADEDNVMMLARPGLTGSTSTYHVHYFGRMNTTTQSYAQPRMDCPYVYYSSYNIFSDPAIRYWSGASIRTPGDVYGSLTGDDPYDGGALLHSSSLGVGRIIFDFPTRLKLERFKLNYNFIPPRKDVVPLTVWFMNHHYFTGNHFGISLAGTTNRFLRLIGDAAEHDVASDFGTAVVGPNAVGSYILAGAAKFIRQNIAIPWGGSSAPGVNSTRTGIQF